MAQNQAVFAFDKELAQTLCNLEVARAIKISPNGQRVVYLTNLQCRHRKGDDQISTLWLALTSELGSSRQLTSGRWNDTQPAWHPDSSQVVFLSDRSNPGKASVLWLLRLDGGDALPITPTDNTESVKTFAISPNGETIAYIYVDEKSKELQKQGKEYPKPAVWGERWDYGRLRLLDLKTKEVRTFATGNRHVTDLVWSHNGSTLAFQSVENPDIEEAALTGTTISTVDIESGDIRDVHMIKNGLDYLTYAHDSKIYFLTGASLHSELSGHAVYALDPAETLPRVTKVACGDEDDAAGLAIAGGKLLVHRQARLSSVISELGGRDLFRKDTHLPAWDVFTNPQDGSSTLVANLSDPDNHDEVFVVREGQEDIRLSNHGQAFANRSFGRCDVLTCQSSDDEVELDGLYLTPTTKVGPDGRPKEPLPTFVIIHGGPTTRVCSTFDATSYYWVPYVLSQGYGVLLPQYRGSTGRGEKFASYSVGGQGKFDYADVISITDNAIKKGFADSKKLMVGGWSQGGLLTYLCSVRNGLHGLGWRFNAGVAGAGICDIDSLALTSDLGATSQAELNGGLSPWTLSPGDTRGRQGSALWEVASAVEESRRRGQPGIPPVLILHGDLDERCPISQAHGFRRALRAHGLPCEFVEYTGQGHVLKPQGFWLDMLERIGRWCDTYIGPGMESTLAKE